MKKSLMKYSVILQRLCVTLFRIATGQGYTAMLSDPLCYLYIILLFT